MNSRQQLPSRAAIRRRRIRLHDIATGHPMRRLHVRRRGIRAFAYALITLAVVLCVLAVFA